MAVRPSCTWAQRYSISSVHQAPTNVSLSPAFVRCSHFPVLGAGKSRHSLRGGSWATGKVGKSGAVSVRATLAAEEAPSKVDLSGIKAELLGRLAGLDRGLVATPADQEEVDKAARKLEAAGNAVEFPDDLDLLQGRWRLVYSSGFGSGSFGGSRPGPPIGQLLPLTLGQAYQRIDVPSRQCDNIVDLKIAAPWPLPPLEVTATLGHTFELTGGGVIRITADKTIVKPGGGLSELPPLQLPQLPELPGFLRPPSGSRSAEFDNTFVDDETRITRGDRGELRIFVKA